MKNVILPTDFSENAWKAISYAAQLFHNEACNFIIVNTFTIPYIYSEAGALPDIEPLIANSKAQLDETLIRFKEFDHNYSSTFNTVSKFASLVDTISEIEAEFEGDCMVIMGTKGASGLGEIFLGTMTSHVINYVKSPVICVPNAAELTPPRRIMLAVDSEGVDRKEEIMLMVDIAEEHEASINIVNVPIGEAEVLAEDSPEQFVVDHYLNKVPHTYHSLTGKYRENLLTEFVERNAIDLIAMIRRDRGFWKNLFHRSLTKSMAFHCDKPLLILRD
jgi:nucleotide-binding universal stress UspA family protein